MEKLTIDIDIDYIESLFDVEKPNAEEILSEVLAEEGEIMDAIDDFLIERYIDRVKGAE